MQRLADKVAIITGSGSGMGAKEAILFAHEGAVVIVTDRDETKGQLTVKAIHDLGGTALFIPHDVTKEQSWHEVIAQTTQTFGKVDILVNNAAVLLAKTLETTTVLEWEQMFDVNAKSVFLGCKQVIPIMRQNGGGVIVNVSSMFAFVGKPGMTAYITAKGAVKILSKALAAECAADNIRVNALCPGLIETPMVTQIMGSSDLHDHYLSKILMGRAGKSEEIAKAALFLASDDSSYMTGSELVVDGGYTAI